MGVIARGTKNAFRNTIRTVSITLILALSIAMALVMLLSLRAVESRIDDVKSSVGNTISVSPAGLRGFQGGGDPLTAADVKKVEAVPHVASVTSTLQDQWTSESADTGDGSFSGPGGGSSSGLTTNLESAIEPGTRPDGSEGGSVNVGGPPGGGTFVLPIMVTGTTDPTSTRVSETNSLTITDGTTVDGTSTDRAALVGTDLATKNNLTVGSTFTAGTSTITVVGIYETGNAFSDGGVIMALPALQALTDQPDAVTGVTATVDSIDNLESTTTAIHTALGDSADVVSDSTGIADTVASLDNVKTIAMYSLVGALVAGAVIIFLSMLMIVRERRREIGVLKAIGSSNAKVSLQFIAEAATLTFMAALIGVLAGIVLSNPVLDVMVNNSDSTSNIATGFPAGGPGGQGGPVINAQDANGNTSSTPQGGPRGGGPISFPGGLSRGVTQFGDALSNVDTVIGIDVLLYGFLLAVFIAIAGSAVPAYLTAKVRPAEVMRVD
jgi:putative ABC transport system permease protein